MNLPTENTPIVNREIALKRLNGNEILYASLTDFFLEDAPQLMLQLVEARNMGDLPSVAHKAHSIKGLSSTFEATRVVAIAKEIELSASQGLETSLEEIERLQQELGRLVSHLQATRRATNPGVSKPAS